MMSATLRSEHARDMMGAGDRVVPDRIATVLRRCESHRYTDPAARRRRSLRATRLRRGRGSSELDRVEFEKGRRLLAEKVMRYRPKAIGFLGVTVFRGFWPELSASRVPKTIQCGPRGEILGGSRLFVLPNPSCAKTRPF